MIGMDKLTYSEKEWGFARKVLLEIKKQQREELTAYPSADGIAYNVALLLDKEIPIERLGKNKYPLNDWEKINGKKLTSD